MRHWKAGKLMSAIASTTQHSCRWSVAGRRSPVTGAGRGAGRRPPFVAGRRSPVTGGLRSPATRPPDARPWPPTTGDGMRATGARLPATGPNPSVLQRHPLHRPPLVLDVAHHEGTVEVHR